MTYETIAYENRAGIGVVTLNRPERLNAINRRFLGRANAAGSIFLTHTTLRGRYTLRLVVGQRTTEERHVRGAWDVISAAAAEVLAA